VNACLLLIPYQGACSTCVSECPLASSHLAHMLSNGSNQGASFKNESIRHVLKPFLAEAHAADAVHPIQLIARSYRLGDAKLE
jgi:hypothetical protein